MKMVETEGFPPQLFILHYSLFIIGFIGTINPNLKVPIVDAREAERQAVIINFTRRTLSGRQHGVKVPEGETT